MSEKVADDLYRLGGNHYETFVDLLIELTENTILNTRNIEILIKLDYFSDFGSSGLLMMIWNEFTEGEYRYKNICSKPRTYGLNNLRIRKMN